MEKLEVGMAWEWGYARVRDYTNLKNAVVVMFMINEEIDFLFPASHSSDLHKKDSHTTVVAKHFTTTKTTNIMFLKTFVR